MAECGRFAGGGDSRGLQAGLRARPMGLAVIDPAARSLVTDLSRE